MKTSVLWTTLIWKGSVLQSFKPPLTLHRDILEMPISTLHSHSIEIKIFAQLTFEYFCANRILLRTTL